MVPAVRFTGITKGYPGVIALRDVSFDVEAGTCHAVCGENGAGKSTLGKLLSGLDRADEGTIAIDGREIHFDDPSQALAAGIAMVHQELAFCDNLSVAENLCLSGLPARWTFVSRRAMLRRAREQLTGIGDAIDVTRAMSSLSVAEQQLVQVAAAVGSGARIIVFDEPTSSLGEAEAARLHALVGQLTQRGVTVLYVSHRMPEIFQLCSRVTVLRDGRHVVTTETSGVTERELVRLMIGRAVDRFEPAHVSTPPREELLRVEGLSAAGAFDNVSFTLRAGEVLGLGGLVGAGRSELAQALFGLRPLSAGRVFVNGVPVQIRTPPEAMALGIGLVPEDRKRLGLVLPMLARENVTLPILRRLARRTFVNRAAERSLARDYCDRLRVRAPQTDVVVAGLSGGNQQKVVLARWLAAGSRVLILDEPTRGVDVGTKAELHAWIDGLAAAGHAVLLISSELPELLNLSSRILVLRHGRIAGEVPRAAASQDAVLRLMAGLEAVAIPA